MTARKKATTATITDPFRATGAQLREAAAAGDLTAQAELDRRSAKHSAKSSA